MENNEGQWAGEARGLHEREQWTGLGPGGGGEKSVRQKRQIWLLVIEEKDNQTEATESAIFENISKTD